MTDDIGVSAAELRLLVRCAPDEPLLHRRMKALRLDPDDLARVEPALLRDLQRVCALCASSRQCAWDLAQRSDDPIWQDWRDYCPNVATLNMLSALNSCFLWGRLTPALLTRG